jgi:lipopolysaccharide biosynthesis regulator YciM
MAMYRLGKLYKNLNNKELAEKYLVDALMDNNNEKALVCLSHLNLQNHKYDLARYYMNRAIEKNPMNSANLKILEDYVSKQKK